MEKLSVNRVMDAVLARKIPDIAALCERYGVSHLELFDSAAGPDFNHESSDCDFLVELDDRSAGSRAHRWFGLADALEALLGRPVDLVNPRMIRNTYFLRVINITRVPIYDRLNAQTAG